MKLDLRYLLACSLLLGGCPDSPVGSGIDTDDEGTSTGDATMGPTGNPTSASGSTGDSTSSSTTADPDTGSSGEGSSSGDASSSSSTGTPDAPEIEVSIEGNAVESADVFTAPDTTAVDDTGDVLSIEITNSGDGDLEIGGVTVEGPAAAHFVLDDAGLATTVAPGESTTVSLTFTPTNGGAKEARVVIANNDADEDPFEIEVRASTTPNLWRNITPATGPAARYNMALAVLEPGTLLTFGGRGAGGAILSDTWTYDIEAGTWTDVMPDTAPSARFSYGMDNAGPGLVVLTGGTTAAGDGGSAQGDTWHFDAMDMTWTMSAGNGTPPVRHQAAVAGFDGGIFSYGGIDDSPAFTDGLFLYDAGTETWVALDVPDPGVRVSAAAAFDGVGVVTLTGGVGNGEPGTLADGYDFVLDDSSIVAHTDPTFGPVFNHEIVYLRPGFAVQFGGRDDSNVPLQSTWSYEPDTSTWTNLGPIVSPSARYNFGMTAVGENKLIMFGGSTAGKGAVPTFEVWEYVGPLPE